MKIGVVSVMEGFPWGGSEELWKDVAISAINENHEVVACLKHWNPVHSKIADLEKKGVKIFFRRYNERKPFPFYQGLVHRFAPPKEERCFLPFFEQDPDVILVSEGRLYNLLHFPELYTHLEQYDKPYYILSHGAFDYGSLNYQDILKARTIYGKAKKLFFVSHKNKVTAERQLAMDFSKAIVVRNPVNLVEPKNIPLPEQVEINFAVVGRLECDIKGQDLLLHVFSSDKWMGRKFMLNLYGEGKDKDYLMLLVDKFNLKNKVKYHGTCKVEDIWKNNHLLVSPSITEGLPLSLVEAMLSGRTAIVTDVAGHAEWVIDNFNGFIASSYQLHHLDEALERMWNQKDNLEDLGQKARTTAIKLYGGKPALDLLNEILTE